MHNCKQTRSSLIELALDETQPAQQKELLAELKDCAACQEEYATLRSTLRISDQALRCALPAESFWPGYHDRLKQQIERRGENHSSAIQRGRGPQRLWIRLRQMVTASLRVPVPVAAALMLLFAVSTFFALRARGPAQPATKSPSVEIRTVEVRVPVFQEKEKVVTRVVYVERNRRRSRSAASELDPTAVAKAEEGSSGTTAMSLVGFKPTDQVKLKIMKGSYRDEK